MSGKSKQFVVSLKKQIDFWSRLSTALKASTRNRIIQPGLLSTLSPKMPPKVEVTSKFPFGTQSYFERTKSMQNTKGSSTSILNPEGGAYSGHSVLAYTIRSYLMYVAAFVVAFAAIDFHF